MTRRSWSLVLSITVVLAACGDGTAGTATLPEADTTTTTAATTTTVETTTTTAATTTTLPERYSLSVRQGYLAGCEAESPGGTYCQCTLGEFEKRLTEDEFVEWAMTVDADAELPDEFFDIVIRCLSELEFGSGGEVVGGQFSDEIRESYLEGCESESPGGNFCVCTLELIEERFTEEEFIRFAIQATEDPPEEFFEIAFACVSELDL